MPDAYTIDEPYLKVSLLPLNSVHLPLCTLLAIVIRLFIFVFLFRITTALYSCKLRKAMFAKSLAFMLQR